MEQMTVEQAIGWIEWKYALDEETQDSKALKMAVDALEKQVPKKPIRETNRTYPDYCWFEKCPACGHNLGDEKYCSNCGQLILWE